MNSQKSEHYSPHCINQASNPFYYPLVDPRYPLQTGAELTLGDLHSNTIVLLTRLIAHNILEISKYDFDALLTICLKSPQQINREDVKEFEEILNSATINTNARFGCLRLLGDEVADRNDCSLWPLLVLRLLHDKGLLYVIIFSNHGLEMLANYLQGLAFHGYKMIGEYIRSLTAMEILVQRNIVSRSFINRLIEKYYLPHLKLIDYSIGKDNRITSYSHSYTNRTNIAKIAAELDIEDAADYPDGTLLQRIKILEKIQTRFMDSVQNKKILQLLNRKVKTNKDGISEIVKLIWGRIPLECHPEDRHVNGHDRTENAPSNIFLLDNNFGKLPFPCWDNFHAQQYKALYTYEDKLADHYYFRDSLEEIRMTINPEAGKFISNADLDALLDEKDICSSFQMNGLRLLLCSEDSREIWTMFLCSSLEYTELMNTITRKAAFRDCFYLVYDLGLQSSVLLDLLLQQDDYQPVFLFLLMIAEEPELLGEKLVYFLSVNAEEQKLLCSLLMELREAEEYDEENIEKLLSPVSENDRKHWDICFKTSNYVKRMMTPGFELHWFVNEDFTNLYAAWLSVAREEKVWLDAETAIMAIRELSKDALVRKISSLLFEAGEKNYDNSFLMEVAACIPRSISRYYKPGKHDNYPDESLINVLVRLLEYSIIVAGKPLGKEFISMVLQHRTIFRNIAWMWGFMLSYIERPSTLLKNFKRIFIRGETLDVVNWFIMLHEGKNLLEKYNFELGITLANKGLLKGNLIACIRVSSNAADLLKILLKLDLDKLLDEIRVEQFIKLAEAKVLPKTIEQNLLGQIPVVYVPILSIFEKAEVNDELKKTDSSGKQLHL